MFNWLSTKKSEAFGQDLASMLMELVPKESLLVESKRLSKSNYAKEKLQKRIRHFKQEDVLNFFKTAKLLNTFKWALKDAGYDNAFVESFASWVFIGLRNQNF